MGLSRLYQEAQRERSFNSGNFFPFWLFGQRFGVRILLLSLPPPAFPSPLTALSFFGSLQVALQEDTPLVIQASQHPIPFHDQGDWSPVPHPQPHSSVTACVPCSHHTCRLVRPPQRSNSPGRSGAPIPRAGLLEFGRGGGGGGGGGGVV